MLLTHRDGTDMRLNMEKAFRNLFQYNWELYFCMHGLNIFKSDLFGTSRRKLNLCDRSIKYI